MPVKKQQKCWKFFTNASNEGRCNDDLKPFTKANFRDSVSGMLKHYSHQILHVEDSIEVPMDVDVGEPSNFLLHTCMIVVGEQRVFYMAVMGGHNIEKYGLQYFCFTKPSQKTVQICSDYKKLHLVSFFCYLSAEML